MLKSVPAELHDAADFTLPKTRKNDVGRAIQEVGLRPDDFEWRDDTQSESSRARSQFAKVSALIHRPTGSYFVFEMQPLPNHFLLPSRQGQGFFGQQREPPPQLAYRFRPGAVASVEAVNIADSNQQLEYVTSWLGRVKEEHEAPDFWGNFAGTGDAIAGSAFLDNTPFTPEERGRLETQLDEIREYLESVIEAQADTREFVRREFEYLKESSQRIGRKDWVLTFIGLLTSIVFSDPTVQAQASELFRFAMRQIGIALNFACDAVHKLMPPSSG